MGALAVAALLLQAAAADDPQAAGLKALEAKDYPAAVAAFEKAVAADAEDYAAHFHLALSHSLAGSAAQAIAPYRRTLELKPGLYEAELNLGIVLLGQKQAAEAVVLLRAAAQKKPKEFRPVYYYAEALAESGNSAEAEVQYRAALLIDPNAAPARASLGRLLARSGKRTEAGQELRQAGDADGLLELASLYEQANEFDPAIAIYESHLAASGEDAAVRERLGLLMLNAGRPRDAAVHLEAAVKASRTAANLYALGTAYLRDKQLDKAMATTEQAVAADPDNATLRLTYASLLRDEKKDFTGAAQQFWKATQAAPESKEAWTGLATMLLLLENYPQTVAALDKVESLGDPIPGIYFLRALAFDKTKQYEPALANYRKFLSVSQDRSPDEEFKARQRVKVIEKELSRR